MDNLTLAITICKELEKRIRPFGWHVALTGSTLYGHPPDGFYADPPPKNDIDIALYPGTQEPMPLEVVAKVIEGMDIKITRPFHQGDPNYSDVPSRWFCQSELNGVRVDFIILA